MPIEESHRIPAWLAGSPWKDMRLHARLEPGSGVRMQAIEQFKIHGRRIEWMLTAEDHAALLLPAAREELKELPIGSRRLLVQPDFRDGHSWVRVTCLDRDLEAVFLRFCESVLGELTKNASTAAAIGRALSRFRRLFEQADTSIDGERIAGLVAELCVLEWLVVNKTDAISAWRGPYDETHDFIFENAHIEVKGLPASGERKCRISNIHQLEVPPNATLFLIGVRLAPGRETIGTILNRILPMLCEDDAKILEAAMLSAGCPIPVSASWNARGFSPGPVEAWRVDSDFPRLVRALLDKGALPNGVSDVRYTVSLEVASSNLVDPKQVISTLNDNRNAAR